MSQLNHIFANWKDSDFFGPKAKHIYFYGAVDSANVHRLRNDLQKASQSTIFIDTNTGMQVESIPKPIVIHIHSEGGNADLGLTMVNFLREVPVPIAIVVDGYACSAVTPLLVSASYRLMHEFAFVLIHESSIVMGDAARKSGDMKFTVNKYMQSIDNEYSRLYLHNTKIPEDELVKLFSRDKFLNSHSCQRYGIVDRVIVVNRIDSLRYWNGYMKQNPNVKTLVDSNDPSSWHTALNHIYNYDNNNVTDDNGNSLRSLQTFIKPFQKIMEDTSFNIPKPIVLHVNQSLSPRILSLFDISSIIIRMNLIRIPIISIIDSNIDILQAIPAIMSYKRFMYKNTYLHIRLEYDHAKVRSSYYHDIKYNTELVRKSLVKLLRTYTKIPNKIMSTLFENRIILSANECKAYGIIDEVIEPIARKNLVGGSTRIKRIKSNIDSQIIMQGGGCMCSQGLPLGIPR